MKNRPRRITNERHRLSNSARQKNNNKKKKKLMTKPSKSFRERNIHSNILYLVRFKDIIISNEPNMHLSSEKIYNTYVRFLHEKRVHGFVPAKHAEYTQIQMIHIIRLVIVAGLLYTAKILI